MILGTTGRMACLLMALFLVACGGEEESAIKTSATAPSVEKPSPKKTDKPKEVKTPKAEEMSKGKASKKTQDSQAGRWLEVVGGETKHDFGPIPDTEAVHHTFKVRNPSDQPVIIVGVKSSCGCAYGICKPPRLMPGEEGEIISTYNPVNRQGKDTKVLMVQGGPEGEATRVICQLTVKCEVRPMIAVEPRSLGLPNVERNTPSGPKEVAVVVRVPGKKPTSVESRDPAFTVKPVRVEDTMEGDLPVKRFVYEVNFAGQPMAGRVRAQILVKTDYEDRPQISFNAFTMVTGPVSVSPDIIAVGRLNAGASFERIITVSHRKGLPLEVTQAWFEGAPHLGVKVKMLDPDPRRAGATRIRVRGTAATPPTQKPSSIARLEGALVIKTSEPSEPEVRATMNGWVVPSKKTN